MVDKLALFSSVFRSGLSGASALGLLNWCAAQPALRSIECHVEYDAERKPHWTLTLVDGGARYPFAGESVETVVMQAILHATGRVVSGQKPR